PGTRLPGAGAFRRCGGVRSAALRAPRQLHLSGAAVHRRGLSVRQWHGDDRPGPTGTCLGWPRPSASTAGRNLPLTAPHRPNPASTGTAMLQLDVIHTLALAGLVLFLGYALCRYIPVLSRYNLPAPVIGGLVVAIAAMFAHGQGHTLLVLDTSLQAPLMIAFF